MPISAHPAVPAASDGDDLLAALLRHFSGDAGPDMPAREPALIRALRAELDANALLRDDMVRLWRMLTACMARVDAPPRPREPLRLLNLACAHCEEAPVLGAFFGRGRPVRFYGMDVRAHAIDQARRRYEVTEAVFRKFASPTLVGERSEIEFIADDATRLGGYRQLPATFDVIFLRHQNVWNDRAVWRRIFAFALDRLADDGVVGITSYFDHEHLAALESFRALGAETLVSLANPHSRPLDHPGKSVDRHVAMLRRARVPAPGDVRVKDGVP